MAKTSLREAKAVYSTSSNIGNGPNAEVANRVKIKPKE